MYTRVLSLGRSPRLDALELPTADGELPDWDGMAKYISILEQYAFSWHATVGRPRSQHHGRPTPVPVPTARKAAVPSLRNLRTDRGYRGSSTSATGKHLRASITRRSCRGQNESLHGSGCAIFCGSPRPRNFPHIPLPRTPPVRRLPTQHCTDRLLAVFRRLQQLRVPQRVAVLAARHD